MKVLQQKKKPLLALLSTVLLTALTIIACRKGGEPQAKSHEFDPHTAMEWFYDFFEKSAEGASYNAATNGKKSPDWSHSFYRKIGNMEIVEFPLLRVKSAIFIPREAGRSEADNRRLAESTVSHIAFIKTGGRIMVREIDYIPDEAYAKKKNYDISRNSIARLDAAFSGRLVVRKWNNKEMTRLLVQNGRITRKGRLKPADQAVTGAVANRDAINSLECTTYQICEYERQCYYEWEGDELVKVCDPWIGTGNCWLEQYCENVPDECGSLNAEQCACAMFGDCGGGDEEPEEESCQDKADAIYASATKLAEKEAVEETSNDGTTRQKVYKWKVYTVSGGMIPMYLRSIENGVHVKSGSRWSFQSFVHHSIEKVGTEIAYEVTYDNVNPRPSIAAHLGVPNQVAKMELGFTVHISVICDEIPIPAAHNDPVETEHSWHVSE